MNAAVISIAGLCIYFLGYRFYARYLAEKIYRLDPYAQMPSHTMNDGVDYVPTNKYVLFGHHFASIAGAAPIVGPALAVIWGWVPAFLWVVLGAVLMGCVHDFSALVLSVRNRARSIGDIAGEMIGKKATTAYMIIMFFVLVLVLAVFLLVISGLLIEYPEAVFPVFSLMVIAVCIGLIIYRTNIGLGPASIVGILLMIFAIWWGAGHPYPMPEETLLGPAKTTWIFLLAFYSLVASVLPVWLLLQPRDYLESFKLYAGLALLFVGIVVTGPTIVAPAIRLNVAGAPPIWPFLFITIACGALSGFHSIVSSGTSSKQLANEKDAVFVGYGGMIGESALGLCAVIACTAGFKSSGDWLAHYKSWSSAAGLGAKLTAFVDGSAYFISSLGIPVQIGKTFIALIIIAFAMTTLDTACRLGRYIVAELGDQHKVTFLNNRYIGSGIVAGFAFILAMGTYGGKPAGLLLWPLFGTTNQLLASLVFATVAIYLLKRKTAKWFITIPLVLVAITTFYAMVWNIKGYIQDGNWILTIIGGIILIAGFLLIVLSGTSYMRIKAQVHAESVKAAGR
jgi:carbon starvation protein